MASDDKFSSIEQGTPTQAVAMSSTKPTANVAVRPAANGSTAMCVGGALVLAGMGVGIGCGVGIGYGAFSAPAPVAAVEAVEDNSVAKGPVMHNICHDKKPKSAAWANFECIENDVVVAAEQAGADVTEGYVGGLATDAVPITTPYYQNGMCPVNVHWHLGAEHRSAGEYDEDGKGPIDIVDVATGDDEAARRLKEARLGLRCHHYNENDPKFTTKYDWKHCDKMKVGETYEVHWPHSKAGACGTPHQYQTPFYDGVFCSDTAVGLVLDGTIAVNDAIGVQAQVFTIVNDESYYYPDLFRGMIVEGDFGKDIAAYTGSTTGTSRDNTICSAFAPITWQVDRKCHMVSASTFDAMCADMKAQNDDMSKDLHAHGAREVVDNRIAANNQGADVANPLFRE